MNKDYKLWQDFNNISVEVKIDNVRYNAILYVENEMLKLKVDCTKNAENFNENINIIDIINGDILRDNTKVAFINCFHYGMKHISNGNNNYTYSIYRIDRLLLGLNLNNLEIEEFNACKVVYDSIDDFFDEKTFDIDWKKQEIQIISSCKMHEYNNEKLTFEMLSTIEENIDEYYVKLNKEIIVKLECAKKVNFEEMMKKIYTFRNLMMLLLKKDIMVKKQTLELDGKEYQVIDCNNYKINKCNEELKKHLIFRKVKYNDIENFDNILENFNFIYERAYPLLELLYNTYSNKLPNLNRFLDVITMIEYYSREFDNEKALKLTNSKLLKQKLKEKDEPQFVDRVKSLIININEVFNFSEMEIEEISKNVKDGRTYYVHYEEKGWKLSNDELFRYYNFLEDIILLNIYKLIGLDITKNKYITFFNFYYTKTELLNRKKDFNE